MIRQLPLGNGAFDSEIGTLTKDRDALAAQLAAVTAGRERLLEALINIAWEAHEQPFRLLEIAGDMANDAIRQSEEAKP